MNKKKTLLIFPIILLMSLIISMVAPICAAADDSTYQPRLSAPNSSIPYYSRKLNVYFQTGTPMPNCVAYAYGRIYEMNGEAPLINHGSAGDWYGMNKRNGYYDYGSTPKVGAVACWSGHVAIVEKVNANGSVTISESHWGGTYFDVRTYSNMNSHYGQKFYGYIYTYNGGVTKELENRLLNATNKNNDVYKTEKVNRINLDNQFAIAKTQLAMDNTEKEIAPTIPLLSDQLK